MSPLIKPNYLLQSELDYELRIRGVVCKKDAIAKRKILLKLLSKPEVGIIPDPEYDYDNEVQVINSTLDSIKLLITDFSGPDSDSGYKRIITRLIHIEGRISRLVIPEPDIGGAVENFRNEASASCIELEAELDEKVIRPESEPVLGNTQEPVRLMSQSFASQPPIATSTCKNNIHKWGLKFDGSTRSSVNAFLLRVEELSEARGVSEKELFHSAIEFFEADALVWFRSIKSTVSDWKGLVTLLKRDFLPPDFDELLWTEIKSRQQGRNEPITIYAARMEQLFSRLERPPLEATKVKIIKKNLLPQYLTSLALIDVSDVPHLVSLCRRIDEATSTFKTSKISSIEADLAYVEGTPISSHTNNRERGNARYSFNNQRKDVKNSFDPESREKSQTNNRSATLTACWNCSKQGHKHNQCRQRRKRFCYKCGMPEQTVQTCPKCSKNGTGV